MTFLDNVSVVVLNYNRAETTLRCLDALRTDASTLIREVIVVDNGSRPEELGLLRTVDDPLVRLVEVGVNRYFGEGNNIGAEEARGEYLVFLNNDAFVQPGWLTELTRAMAEDPTVAAVGAMLLYPDGRVQEVGGMVLPTGDVVQIGKGAIWDADHYDTVYPVDYCSASCLLMRRSDFFAVGGFSYEYEPAYYEDTDLCLKLWTTIGKVVVAPRARVVHLESHTTSDRSLELSGIVELNRAKFIGEWGERLSDRADRGPSAARPVRPPSSDRSGDPREVTASQISAAVFTAYEVLPGGGERFMFELLGHLSNNFGREHVALATPHPYSVTRVAQISSTFGFDEPVAVPVSFTSVRESTPEIGISVSNAVVPPVPRFARRNIYLCQFPFVVPDEYVMERREWLRDYDEIWVYSEFARRYVRGMALHYQLECPPVRVVNPPATWPSARASMPWEQRRTILTVGRFFTAGHDKRQDVVIDVVRELVQLGWSVDLAMAGSLHTTHESRARYSELVARAEGLQCRFFPNASRKQIEDLYATSAVLVHAAGFGLDPWEFPERLEHFGIVPVEAASLGCIPVVYGEGGPAEVISALGLGSTFHTRGECVEAIVQLLEDPGKATELSVDLQERAQQYSPAAFQKRVSEALEDLNVPGPW